MADLDVDRSVELNPRHFCTGEQTPDMNVMDSVASDYAENWTKATNDPRLFAVRNGVSPNQVRTDTFL
jgi:hypothetical protein